MQNKGKGTGKRKPYLACLLGGALLGVSVAVSAQDKPPIRIMVGYAAGGGSDLLARTLADPLKDTMGRPVIVENRPGAGGRIAAEVVKAAPADGSVYLLGTNGWAVVQSLVYAQSLRYDLLTDFAPVAKLVDNPVVLATATATGTRDARGLVSWAKAHLAAFGSPAAGGLPHFAGLVFARAAGIQMVHVPYKGGNPLSADLMAGQVPVGVSTVEDFIKPRDAGKLNIVGVFGQKRSPLLPDVPTLLEQGFSDTAVESWQAVWAPAGTPKAALEQMQAALQRAMQRPEVKARLTAMLMEPDFRPGAALDALQRKELAMWKPIIRASGFTPNQ